MRIFDFNNRVDGDVAEATARFQANYGCDSSTLVYRFTGLPLCPDGLVDAAAISLLPLCLKAGEELDICETLTAPIARKLDLLQTQIADHPPFQGPITIKAARFDPRKAERVRNGTLAQCCLDDAAEAECDEHPEITHLLLVRGFDPALDDEERWTCVRRRYETTARHHGHAFMTCETNLSHLAGGAYGDAYWHDCLRGAATAAITRLLGGMIGRLVLASGGTGRRSPDPAEVAARYVASSRLH
jgi:hypothetical protein